MIVKEVCTTQRREKGISLNSMNDAEQIALEFEEALDMKLKKKDRSKAKKTAVNAE